MSYLAAGSSMSAARALQMELKSLESTPIEGFKVTCDDNNIFKWTVAIFGPPGTLYQGGYFKASLNFPSNYPFSPPAMRFLQEIWHPNVYKNGELCISILHPPGDDAMSGELASERWNPTQNVRTILLSVISMLNEPNTSSPANVDASISFKKYQEYQDQEYPTRVKKQVEQSKAEAKKDNVVVPETVEEYVIKTFPMPIESDIIDLDEDYYDDGASDTSETMGSEHGEDSGQGDDEN